VIASDAQVIKRLITLKLAGLLDDNVYPIAGTGHWLKALMSGTFKRYDALIIRDLIRTYRDCGDQEKEENKIIDAVHGETSQKFADHAFSALLSAVTDIVISKSQIADEFKDVTLERLSRPVFPTRRTNFANPPTSEDVTDLDEHEAWIVKRALLAHITLVLRRNHQRLLEGNAAHHDYLDGIAFEEHVMCEDFVIRKIKITWREYFISKIVHDKVLQLQQQSYFCDDLIRLVFDELLCIVGLVVAVRTPQKDMDVYLSWFKKPCTQFWRSRRGAYHIVSLGMCELMAQIRSKRGREGQYLQELILNLVHGVTPYSNGSRVGADYAQEQYVVQVFKSGCKGVEANFDRVLDKSKARSWCMQNRRDNNPILNKKTPSIVTIRSEVFERTYQEAKRYAKSFVECKRTEVQHPLQPHTKLIDPPKRLIMRDKRESLKKRQLKRCQDNVLFWVDKPLSGRAKDNSCSIPAVAKFNDPAVAAKKKIESDRKRKELAIQKDHERRSKLYTNTFRVMPSRAFVHTTKTGKVKHGSKSQFVPLLMQYVTLEHLNTQTSQLSTKTQVRDGA